MDERFTVDTEAWVHGSAQTGKPSEIDFLRFRGHLEGEFLDYLKSEDGNLEFLDALAFDADYKSGSFGAERGMTIRIEYWWDAGEYWNWFITVNAVEVPAP